jgi:hypothetical protein
LCRVSDNDEDIKTLDKLNIKAFKYHFNNSKQTMITDYFKK